MLPEVQAAASHPGCPYYGGIKLGSSSWERNKMQVPENGGEALF